jgi:ABC-type arginine/histidine transport system permease subunit
MATRHFGSVAANQIRSYKPDNLPVLLIISRSRATNEVVDVIRGKHINLLEITGYSYKVLYKTYFSCNSFLFFKSITQTYTLMYTGREPSTAHFLNIF